MKEISLGKLIAKLQKAISSDSLNREMVLVAIADLSELGYKYDSDSFPALVDTETFTDTSGNTPSNLAEALLWKLGKWKSYKRFSNNFATTDAKATNSDVVFFAFAKHLKDKDNPIYDQHAIRALWAINGNLSDVEQKICTSVLIDRGDKWKQTGTGKDTIDCYELFVRHINQLVSVSGAPTMSEIDRLLMPLGQAIKKETSTGDQFRLLCGWSGGG